MLSEQWPVIPISDWLSFAQRAHALTPTHSGYPGQLLFRGVADHTEPKLQKPSLADHLEGKAIEAALGIELDALKEFQNKLQKFGDKTDKNFTVSIMSQSENYDEKFDYLEWWSYMHHYRAPTRLLAWTHSPYVALYHAVESGWGNGERHGIVFAFNPYMLGQDEDFRKTERQPGVFRKEHTGEKLFAWRPNWMTSRMLAQQTCFTVAQNPFSDHMQVLHDVLNPKRHGTTAYHFKLCIHQARKQEFLHQLRAMNVTANSLYPGIEGAGASVAEFIRLRRWTQMIPNSSML